VHCGGLTLNIRVHTQDHLRNRFGFKATQEFANAQLVGADSIDWAYRTLQDVVTATKLTGTFDRNDVAGFLDNAEHVDVTPRLAADVALTTDFRNVKAAITESDFVLYLDHCVDQA
jgi:hypothetical protein